MDESQEYFRIGNFNSAFVDFYHGPNCGGYQSNQYKIGSANFSRKSNQIWIAQFEYEIQQNLERFSAHFHGESPYLGKCFNFTYEQMK